MLLGNVMFSNLIAHPHNFSCSSCLAIYPFSDFYSHTLSPGQLFMLVFESLALAGTVLLNPNFFGESLQDTSASFTG